MCRRTGTLPSRNARVFRNRTLTYDGCTPITRARVREDDRFRGTKMKHPVTTPPFRTRGGGILPGSIAEITYLRLGEIDQWVMIRGRSVANPLLILLHGGPGFPEVPLFRFFNASLESKYTVVYWAQRGTGKSFDRSIPPSAMRVERFIADLDELVDAVLDRFK